MTNLQLIIISLIFLLSVLNLRTGMIASYKIGYYEQKLEDRDIEISHIKKIGLIEILKS